MREASRVLCGLRSFPSRAGQVVREADGYQPHLVSPEYGLQRLVDETLALTLEPVSTCVRRVHQVLLDAARHAPLPLLCACCARVSQQ